MKNLNYFYMPNRAFNYGLSANEISVLAILYSCAKESIVKISQKAIADKLGIKKEETVSRCIRRLCGCGFILAEKRPYRGINRLGVKVYYLLPASRTDGYFRVDRRVLKLRLKPSHLRVYLFICKAVKSCTQTMWNSYNDIANAIKSTRSAVMRIIADLVNLSLIKKIKIKKENGAYSDNHYILCSVNDKRKIAHKKVKSRRLFPITCDSCPFPLANNRIALPIAISYDIAIDKRCQVRKRKKFRKDCKYFFNTRGSP